MLMLAKHTEVQVSEIIITYEHYVYEDDYIFYVLFKLISTNIA